MNLLPSLFGKPHSELGHEQDAKTKATEVKIAFPTYLGFHNSELVLHRSANFALKLSEQMSPSVVYCRMNMSNGPDILLEIFCFKDFSKDLSLIIRMDYPGLLSCDLQNNMTGTYTRHGENNRNVGLISGKCLLGY